jgi:hypothetical protein
MATLPQFVVRRSLEMDCPKPRGVNTVDRGEVVDVPEVRRSSQSHSSCRLARSAVRVPRRQPPVQHFRLRPRRNRVGDVGVPLAERVEEQPDPVFRDADARVTDRDWSGDRSVLQPTTSSPPARSAGRRRAPLPVLTRLISPRSVRGPGRWEATSPGRFLSLTKTPNRKTRNELVGKTGPAVPLTHAQPRSRSE